MAPTEALNERVGALEARLKLLEDERELRELLSRYGFTADLGRVNEYVELHTADGRSDMGARVLSGREELYKFFTTSERHKCIEGFCQHHALTGPVIFHIDGDEAIAEGYSLVVVQSDEAQRRTRSCMPEFPEINIRMAGFDRWTFSRVDGRWQIRDRVSRELGVPELYDVFTESLAEAPAPSS